MAFDPNRTFAPMTSGQAPQTIAAPGTMSPAMCQADELRAAEDTLRRQRLIAGYATLEDAHQAWAQYQGQMIAGAESAANTLTTIRDGAMAVEVGTAAMSPATQESTHGALQQIANDDTIETLRLAIHGVVGIAVGLGGSVAAIFSGLATLFTDPLKFIDDLMTLPSVAQQIWANRAVLFAQFATLPPEEQAQAIGTLVGHLTHGLHRPSMGLSQ